MLEENIRTTVDLLKPQINGFTEPSKKHATGFKEEDYVMVRHYRHPESSRIVWKTGNVMYLIEDDMK